MEPPDQQSPQAVPPAISVTVAPGAMSARLVVEPSSESPVGELTGATVLAVLKEHRVVSGIRTTVIEDLVREWNNGLKRRYDIADIAAGKPPQPGREDSYSMTVRHLSTAAQCALVKNARWFWEIAGELPKVDRVRPGDTIAEKQMAALPLSGENIYGEPVFTDEVVRTFVIPETGAELSDDRTAISAKVDGIAYRIDDAYGVLPINFNGTFEIEIASDAMTALCFIRPPGPGGSLPPENELRRLLAEKGVTFGIRQKDITMIMELCSRNGYPREPFVVAQGIPPVKGEDGRLEYHFNTDTSLSPAIDDDGHADYKTVNIVTMVHAGQKLVTLINPTPGDPGTDVLGRTLPAEAGKPTRIPQGPHTVVDPADSQILLAETDGIVRHGGSAVEVCEGFVIPGNVDFSTGNIEYAKTVIVNGDVKSGFTIQCGGDLQVNGTIEDCSVTTGGNILCRFGFVGQGKGCIETKGDVNLGFMKNQTVRSFRNVNIAKEAINCTIYSRKSVHVHGNPLSVAGGEVKARDSITVHTAGNHTGIRTLLEAGIDYLMAEELTVLGEQLDGISEEINRLANTYARFKKNMARKRRLSTAEQRENDRYIDELRQAKQRSTVIEERKVIVGQKVYTLTGAFIRIEHAAFPGTLFKFGERHLLLKEELVGPKTVRMVESEIKII